MHTRRETQLNDEYLPPESFSSGMEHFFVSSKMKVKLLADNMKVILDQRSYYKRLASRAGSKDRLKGILLESDISRH